MTSYTPSPTQIDTQTPVGSTATTVGEIIAVAALVVHPYAAWIGALLLLLLHPPSQQAWAARQAHVWVWGGTFGFIIARYFVAQQWTFLWQTLLQVALIIAASVVLQARPRNVARGIVLALALLVSLAIGERLMLARSWQVDDERLEYETGLLVGQDSVREAPVYRLWDVPADASTMTLSFDARYLSGPRGWYWQTIPRDTPIEYHPSDVAGSDFTRITFAEDGDPYALQRFDVPEGVTGRRFRVSVQLRTVQPLEDDDDNVGRVYLFADDNNTRWGRAGLGPAWRTISYEWDVPGEANTDSTNTDSTNTDNTSETISIILNDFNGLIVDIRRAKLEVLSADTWTPVGVAEDTGATIALTQRGQDPMASLRFMPQANWQRFELTSAVPDGVAGELLGLLRLEPHLAVQTRNVTLDTDAGRAQPLPHTRRQALWYAQPNLLGHTLAVATVLVVLTSSSPLLLASGILLGFVGIWLTGSRAAYGAALLGVFWLAWLRLPRQRRWYLLAAAALLVTVALGFQEQLGRLQVFGVNVRTSRVMIWRTAVRGFLSAPWLGLGDNTPADFAAGIPAKGLQAFWQETHPTSQELVSHAHNVWLSLSSRYGIFGVAAALWLSVTLPLLAWRVGRWYGLALVVVLAVLNTVDETLFHTTTLLLFALGLHSGAGLHSSAGLGLHSDANLHSQADTSSATPSTDTV